MFKHAVFLLIGAFSALVLALSPSAAQDSAAPAAKDFSTEQLDQMLAPIALYPDDLLSNVLVGSTYPLEIVQSARWRKEAGNAKLKGDALEKALQAKDWDPSVKSLVLFPDVLQTMSDKLDWTQKLGDAFLAQQSDVMDRVQFLRQKADEAGSLKSNDQQKVTRQEKVIVIEPAKTDVVYVPVYQPTVVYGPWWYPAYPPYYWYWGRPASSFVSGFFWGAGFAIGTSVWRWGHFNWHHHDIDININNYNRINVNRTQITSNKWQHDPHHRGKVPYRNKDVRDKFGKTDDRLKDAHKDFRGFDKDKAGEVRDKLGEGAGSKIKDRVPEGSADKMKDKLGDGAGPKIKDRVPQGGADKVRDKAADRMPSAKLPDKSVVHNRAPQALDVRKGSDVKRNVDRGAVSRKAAAQHAPSRPSINRGGGGGHKGGGRRR